MAAQDLTNKKQSFMTRYVAAVREFLDARDKLRSLRSEWDAQGYSSGIVQNDISQGGHLHLTPTVMGDAFNAQTQLENLLGNVAVTQGAWGTNLFKVAG